MIYSLTQTIIFIPMIPTKILLVSQEEETSILFHQHHNHFQLTHVCVYVRV